MKEREDVRERDPEARLEGEHDRAEHHVHERGEVEGCERIEEENLEGLDDVPLEDAADEEDHEQHSQEDADQDRDPGHGPGEETVDPRAASARGGGRLVRDRPGVVVPVGRDDLPGRHPVPPPDLLAHGPGRLEELGVVADPLERLEGRAPVDPEGPGEGVERGLDVVVVRDLDRARPGLEHGRGQDPVDPLSRRGRGREHGDAEQGLEPLRVDRDPAAVGLVDHVHDRDHRPAVLGDLEEEVEVALEPCRVEDRDDRRDRVVVDDAPDERVGLGPVLERVDPGQVQDLDPFSLEAGGSREEADRGARVVADLDPDAGQLVEDERLAHARVADERDGQGHGAASTVAAHSGESPISQPLTSITTARFESRRRTTTSSPGTDPHVHEPPIPAAGPDDRDADPRALVVVEQGSAVAPARALARPGARCRAAQVVRKPLDRLVRDPVLERAGLAVRRLAGHPDLLEEAGKGPVTARDGPGDSPPLAAQPEPSAGPPFEPAVGRGRLDDPGDRGRIEPEPCGERDLVRDGIVEEGLEQVLLVILGRRGHDQALLRPDGYGLRGPSHRLIWRQDIGTLWSETGGVHEPPGGRDPPADRAAPRDPGRQPVPGPCVHERGRRGRPPDPARGRPLEGRGGRARRRGRAPRGRGARGLRDRVEHRARGAPRRAAVLAPRAPPDRGGRAEDGGSALARARGHVGPRAPRGGREGTGPPDEGLRREERGRDPTRGRALCCVRAAHEPFDGRCPDRGAGRGPRAGPVRGRGLVPAGKGDGRRPRHHQPARIPTS